MSPYSVPPVHSGRDCHIHITEIFMHTNIQPHVLNCPRCGLSLDDILESQESMFIQFRAGYGSVFGDGNVVTGRLCQYCVQEVLGPWLTVESDDPFEPTIKLNIPRQAFQPNQLSSDERSLRPDFRHPTREEIEALLAQLNDPDGIWLNDANS